MKRKAREATREVFEQRRQEKAARAAKAREEAARREKAVQTALARHPGTDTGAGWFDLTAQASVRRKIAQLQKVKDFRAAFQWITSLSLWHVRPIKTWEPKGKGYKTVFRSLCEHLFAQYKVPAFLWNIFFEAKPNDELILAILHVAKGGSLFKVVQEGRFPVPLTRQMCHELLQTTGDLKVTEAIRRVQVKTAGGDPRLLQAWLSTETGQRLHSLEVETFWASVLAWFAKNTMVDPEQVSPLLDYIAFRQRQDAKFSMKGRSVLALLRGMQEWHGELAKAKALHGKVFKPSGFREADFDRSKRLRSGEFVREVWHVREILTSKALAEEGRVMRHCVFSYGWRIEKGDTSIWTLTLEDDDGHWRMLTIEVRNDIRRIVQARGRFNQASGTKEFQILAQWAGMNNLEVSLGRW